MSIIIFIVPFCPGILTEKRISKVTFPSFGTISSVLSPVIDGILVSPGITDIFSISGCPSIKGIISSGVIPLNSVTTLASMCAKIIFSESSFLT